MVTTEGHFPSFSGLSPTPQPHLSLSRAQFAFAGKEFVNFPTFRPDFCHFFSENPIPSVESGLKRMHRHEKGLKSASDYSDADCPLIYFPDTAAVFWPSSIPSVDSLENRIFTVASMIVRSSYKEGFAMYIKSIRSLS